MKYLMRLNVYQFSKNKTKCDYSIIPVEMNGGKLKSTISPESIDMMRDDVVWTSLLWSLYTDVTTNTGIGEWVMFEKGESKSCKINYVVDSADIESEEKDFIKQMIKMFKKHFWYKFNYKVFIDKKVKNNQL